MFRACRVNAVRPRLWDSLGKFDFAPCASNISSKPTAIANKLLSRRLPVACDGFARSTRVSVGRSHASVKVDKASKKYSLASWQFIHPASPGCRQ